MKKHLGAAREPQNAYKNVRAATNCPSYFMHADTHGKHVYVKLFVRDYNYEKSHIHMFARVTPNA